VGLRFIKIDPRVRELRELKKNKLEQEILLLLQKNEAFKEAQQNETPE